MYQYKYETHTYKVTKLQLLGPNFKSDPMTTEVFQTEIGIHTMQFPITCIKKLM